MTQNSLVSTDLWYWCIVWRHRCVIAEHLPHLQAGLHHCWQARAFYARLISGLTHIFALPYAIGSHFERLARALYEQR